MAAEANRSSRNHDFFLRSSRTMFFTSKLGSEFIGMGLFCLVKATRKAAKTPQESNAATHNYDFCGELCLCK